MFLSVIQNESSRVIDWYFELKSRYREKLEPKAEIQKKVKARDFKFESEFIETSLLSNNCKTAKIERR